MGNIHQRVNGMVPRLPRRHCSSLYADPDAGRVCLNMHLIYIHFSLLLCFFFPSFRGVISQRWRSDTFDNCGPCGVNTEVIACLCLLLSRTISECLSPRLFTDRQRGAIGTKEGEDVGLKALNMCHCFIIWHTILRRFLQY